MTINLITEEEYNLLLEIQKEHPILTFQNQGYQYIDKSKFTEEDTNAFNKVTEILKNAIVGFSEFNNFRTTKIGELEIRFQYNWSADSPGVSFTGVGYLLVDELLNGFREKNE